MRLTQTYSARELPKVMLCKLLIILEDAYIDLRIFKTRTIASAKLWIKIIKIT